jgi:hypothetical protein
MLDAHERAILEVLAAHGDGLGWHGLAVRLGARGDHDARNLVQMLRAMVGRGLLASAAEPPRWSATELGRAALAPPGPLAPAELVRWARELSGDVVAALTLLSAELADQPRVVAALLQTLAFAEQSARGTTLILGCLDDAHRRRLADALTTDPRPAVRAAFYSPFAPLRFDVPGTSARLFTADVCAALLRRGLFDPDREVRLLATAMTFGTCSGAQVTDLLLANLAGDDRDLAWRTLAALGSARDGASLAALVRHADGPDEGFAGIAVQALGARDDGRALCAERARSDPREWVRSCAHHALAVAASLAEQAKREGKQAKRDDEQAKL